MYNVHYVPWQSPNDSVNDEVDPVARAKPQPRRGRGTSAGLNRDLVLAGAERVIDREGVEGASIRAVAAELGVSPTAIYNHVTGKSDLIDAVADRFVAREMLADFPEDLTPLEGVRELARRVHRAGVQHPGLLMTIVGHRPEQPQSAQVHLGEELIVRLLAAGATVEQAQLIYRVLVSLATGAAVGVSNLHRPSRSTVEERMQRQVDNSARPEITQILSDMPALGDEAAFEWQIDLALRELEQQAAPSRGRRAAQRTR